MRKIEMAVLMQLLQLPMTGISAGILFFRRKLFSKENF
jgi:hypothetical protein